MKKQEIKNSIKIALVATLLLVGVSVVSAYDWEEPECAPPGCDTSVYALDTGNSYQSKSGILYVEDDPDTLSEEGNLTVDRLYTWGEVFFHDKVVVGVSGITGTPDLFVKNLVRFRNLGEENVENISINYESGLCSLETGELAPCNLEDVPVDLSPFFSAQTDITIVKDSVDSALATEMTVACPGAYPYVIGGGGYCEDGDFLEGKGIKKSEPADLGIGGAGYDGWKISCNVSDKLIEVYAICSK